MRSNFIGLKSLTIFILLSILIFPQTGKNIKILSSDNSSVVFEYKPEILEEIIKGKNGRSFYKFLLEDGVFKSFTPGIPQLPSTSINVGVASEFGATIQILNKEEKIIDGSVIPFPTMQEEGENTKEVYLTNSEYEKTSFGELLTFGEYGIARALRIQKFDIFPIQFDARTNKIKLISKIVVKINLPSNNTPVEKLSGVFYDNLVVNSKIAKNWGVKSENKLRKINDSILSNGKWYKFEVTSEGIYVIKKDQLSSYGIDADVDPSTIKIYNNGGYLLSYNISHERPEGLVENAIKVETVNGKVEQIIFYARGNCFWEYDKGQSRVVRDKHYFETKNYYWITSGGTAGKRISEVSSLQNFDQTQNNTKAYLYNDRDDKNIIQSGRLYVNGDEYNTGTNSRNFINSLPNRVDASQINYRFMVAHYNKTSQKINFKVFESDNEIHSYNLFGSSYVGYDFGSFYSSTSSYSGSLTDDRSNLRFTFAATSAGKGYLDYYEIEYLRKSTAIEDSIIVYAEDSDAAYQYEINGFAGNTNSIKIFDVTSYSEVKEISNAYKSGALVRFNYQNKSSNPNKFYLTTVEKYKTPSNPVQVENSNIRGFVDGVEHIIIATNEFRTQAERLATYRNSSVNPISSKVFYLNEIYNEFSCGLTDPTAIRDFVKYAYDKWNIKPKYLLLFGDGSSDFLGKSENGLKSNIIPIYPTIESIDEVRSYAQEDYYVKVKGQDSYLDLSMGRVCFSDEENAKNIVDKIIAYEQSSEKGLWRNKIAIVADDQYTFVSSAESYHLTQCESLTRNYIPAGFDVNKIYLSAYPITLNSEGNKRKPEVVEAIINAINNDLLLINYTGHGSPQLWAHEWVFTQEYSLKQLNNKNLFFMTVASCDYAKFDDFSYYSAGEELVSMPNKGAIGVMAASRPVEAGGNAALNNRFYSNLLKKQSGQYVSVGEALMLAKNTISGSNSAKFLILGDPAIKLHLPKVEASIDSINSQNLQNDVQIKALSKVKINGSVKNSDGAINTTFNGNAIITVFDSDRINNIEIANYNYPVVLQGGVIFKGSVSVTNGVFSTEFVVPKDISYENKNGKIVAYLFNEDTDGSGFTKNVIIGGTGNLVNDNKGPVVDVYFDDINYENSNLVNSDFKLILDIKDETGLNTTGSGIGHKLEGIVDDDQTKIVDLTNAFVGDKDAGGKSGKVEYKFTGFEAGEHKIKVKAWDVFNNPTEVEEYFSVLNEDGLVIKNIYNFPNPFADKTTFTFQHNLAEAVDVKIKVYTVAGRLIREIEEIAVNDKFVRIWWDGRDQDGSEIANGTYFYKLIVKTVSGEFSKSAVGKLAIIK